MSLASNAASMIARKGESMTLKRTGETDIALKGKRIGGTLDDIGGTAAQQVFRVKIGAAEIAASSWASKVPVRHDSIVIGGRERTIEDVRPLSDGDTVAMYELQVGG